MIELTIAREKLRTYEKFMLQLPLDECMCQKVSVPTEARETKMPSKETGSWEIVPDNDESYSSALCT
jgi:hypothetical protein